MTKARRCCDNTWWDLEDPSRTQRGHNDESGGRYVGSHIGALVRLQRGIDEEPVIRGEVHDDQRERLGRTSHVDTRDRRMTG